MPLSQKRLPAVLWFAVLWFAVFMAAFQFGPNILQAADPTANVDTLRNPVTLHHDQYRSAKRMCVLALHAAKDDIKLPNEEWVRLMHQCSNGNFDWVLHQLEIDIDKGTTVHHGLKGPELVDDWEAKIRDTVQVLNAKVQEGASQ